MASRHVVVDGSNIATEGRSMPSLAQLDQAVREFMDENPTDVVTVVVDASFGHRINSSEVSMYEEAETAGELVSPPAGAIGRGDAFLLRIADKMGATVLSNDSFQEFHGEHVWLFDKGRLIGGKPVPGVGWIFTPRTPVRGPKSREAVKEAKRTKKGEPEAAASAIPGLDLAAERARSKGKGKKTVERAIAVATEEAVEPKASKRRRRRSKGGVPPAEPVNEPLAFITFIAAHPLGTEVEGTVDSFASHGAFVTVEGARCYVPLSAMGDPPPRSGREVFARGDTRRFVIQALDPQRRGIELALPGFVRVAGTPTQETVEAEIAGEVPEPVPAANGRRRTRKPAAAAAGSPAAPEGGPAKRTRKPAAAAPAPAAAGTADGAPAKRTRKRVAAAAPATPSGAPAKRTHKPATAAAGSGPAAGATPAKRTRISEPAKAGEPAKRADRAAAAGMAAAAPSVGPAKRAHKAAAAAEAAPSVGPAKRAGKAATGDEPAPSARPARRASKAAAAAEAAPSAGPTRRGGKAAAAAEPAPSAEPAKRARRDDAAPTAGSTTSTRKSAASKGATGAGRADVAEAPRRAGPVRSTRNAAASQGAPSAAPAKRARKAVAVAGPDSGAPATRPDEAAAGAAPAPATGTRRVAAKKGPSAAAPSPVLVADPGAPAAAKARLAGSVPPRKTDKTAEAVRSEPEGGAAGSVRGRASRRRGTGALATAEPIAAPPPPPPAAKKASRPARTGSTAGADSQDAPQPQVGARPSGAQAAADGRPPPEAKPGRRNPTRQGRSPNRSPGGAGR